MYLMLKSLHISTQNAVVDLIVTLAL